ncbi:MAG: PAS domain-containing protein [Alphaproteobacteria bacterium]
MAIDHREPAGQPACPETPERHSLLRAALDRVARLAARQFDAPVVLISFTGKGRQVLLAECGSDTGETDRHLAFCAKICMQNEIIVVPDTLEDERFRNGPLVKSDPVIRFFAGAPLRNGEGRTLGSLCLLDTRPRRPLTDRETSLLAGLAEIAAGQFGMYPLSGMNAALAAADGSFNVAGQQLCLFMEYAPASMAMFDRNMVYLAATRRWRETFRLGDEDIFGRSHYEVVPWLPERWKREYARCLQGEAMRWEEDLLERPDGSADWLLREIHPWFDGNGDVGGIIVFNEIITERKRTADELERSRRFLNAVLESIQDGIVACDADGRLSVLNPAAKRMVHAEITDTPPEQWAEKYRIYDADGKNLVDEDRLPLIRALRGESVEGEELVLAPDHHPPRRIICTAKAMYSGEGSKLGAVLSMQDVTEQREMETQYSQAQKMEAIGQLTGGLAHDFNNLLAVIIGNLQLVQRSGSGHEKAERRLAAALDAARRGAELTSRLLAFARRQPLAEKPVNANELIRGLTDFLTRSLEENVSVETELQDRLWTICVDDNQLEAALLNLAINARDAMDDGGRLAISTSNAVFDESTARRLELEPGDYVLISVSDTGSGMPDEVRSRAFEPFFTTKEVGRGSGLGLSIVYGFVRQSGGQIDIESGEGRGTTVRMYFPRSFETAGRPEEGSGPEGEVRQGSECILLVEDDAAVRDTAMALLEDLGYRTSEAANGEAALETLRTSGQSFDLLLTDVVMPGRMNGPALAKAAREVCPDLKVLFASGYAGAAVLSARLASGGAGLISKPFRREELARRLREALD